MRFEDTLLAPPTQRVMRDIAVVRLPRLFFCPADRYRQAGVIWNSYECSLSYKMEVAQCDARLQHFGGEEPQDFQHGKNWSDSCLEFQTHRIGVKQEWNAAWNEISLKAAFLQPTHVAGETDMIQEVELGYLPREWEVGSEPSTIEHFYSPLIRVPIYQPDRYSLPGPGVVTRLFLAEYEDHGRHAAGDYWYTYGASHLTVENASVPEQAFLHEHGDWVKAPMSRRSVAHIVITLEDFTKYEYRVQPVIYPLLSLCSQVSGVLALFCWAFFKSPLAGRRMVGLPQPKSEDEGDVEGPPRGRQQVATTTHAGAQYRSIVGEDGEDEEQQSLLEVEARSPGMLQAGTEGEGL